MKILFVIAGLLLALILVITAFQLKTGGWILLSVLALLASYWQSKRLRAHLQSHSAPKLKPSNWKYWGLRLSSFAVIALLGISSSAYYLGQTYDLPKNYQWQAVLWSLGFPPKPTLLKIPTGKFLMGSNTGRGNEKPVHNVTISQAFKMSQHEITFAQYDYYVWQMRQQGFNKLEYPDDTQWGRASRPVINVNWDDAQGYINWFNQANSQGLQCRLPTEAEWEYAARAGTKTTYYWGDNDKKGHDYANYSGVEATDKWDRETAPVGSFKANDFGLQDMSGNVWEWTQDCYEDNYSKAPNNGTAWEGGKCADRVVRGGSWVGTSNDVRSAYRFSVLRVIRYDLIGFRVVCSLPLMTE